MNDEAKRGKEEFVRIKRARTFNRPMSLFDFIECFFVVNFVLSV